VDNDLRMEGVVKFFLFAIEIEVLSGFWKKKTLELLEFKNIFNVNN